MPFQVFYDCQSTGKRVDSDNSQPIELDVAPKLVASILIDEGDFFGLKDSSGTILQFMREQDRVWMEFPAPEEGGSYGVHVAVADVPTIIGGLPNQLDSKQMHNLKFQAWQ